MVANEPDDALTPMRMVAMEKLVELGVSIPVAATSLKCGKRVKAWAAQARTHADRGMKPGFGPGESPYMLWLDTMDAARATAEATLVSAIYMAAPNDWKAAAWILERRFASRWHSQTQLTLTAKSDQRTEITALSTEALLALAKGLLPEDKPKALPADAEDAEFTE
jgi:hypothetical protein